MDYRFETVDSKMWLQQVYLRTKKCTIWWRLIQKKCMLVNRLRTRQLSCRLLNCHFLFAFTYVLIPIPKFIIIYLKEAYCANDPFPTSVGQGKNEKSKEPCHSLHRNVSTIRYAQFPCLHIPFY